MGLVNFLAFSLLKILYNLVSMKYFLNANNCRHNQNFEKCPTRPYHNFLCTSESRIDFVSFLVFLALENVIFTKTSFYRNRSSVTIRNYVETFHANTGHNLA